MSFLNTLSYCWGSVGYLEPLASLEVPAVTRQPPYLLGYLAILGYPAILNQSIFQPVQIPISPNPNPASYSSTSQSGTPNLALLGLLLSLLKPSGKKSNSSVTNIHIMQQQSHCLISHIFILDIC
jgi:hypothetical protein